MIKPTLCCVGAVVLFATVAFADSLQPVYDVAGAIAVARNGVYVEAKSDRTKQASPVQVSFSGAFGTNTGSYFASSAPGTVKIYAASGGQSNNGTDSQAFAYFQDYLTISGAPANSSLHVTFAVDGDGNDNYDGIHSDPRSASLLQDTLQIDAQVCSPVLSTRIPGPVSGSCQLSVPITNATPILLTLQLQGDAENRSGDTSILDFSHTGRITSLQLLDVNGVQLPGSLISTASGYVYPSGAVAAVPEPASIFLMSAALVCLMVSGRRRAANR